MKVLFLITGLGVGGAERQVVDLTDRLAALGYDVTLAYFTGNAILRPKSDRVKLIGLGGNKGLCSSFFAFLRFLKLLKNVRPDLVHGHMFHANIICRVSRVFVKFPKLICSSHSNNEGGRARMLAYRITQFLSDINTNVSNKAVQEFEMKKAVRRGSMAWVQNGIDLDRYKNNYSARTYVREKAGVGTSKVILAVGRMVEAKNYALLLSAFYKLVSSNPNLQLWIAGDGPQRPEIQRKINQLGLSNKVSLLGIRSDIPDLMSAADIFALSSLWEGFGLVVAEAMATECIVVATDCGGVAEVLGGNGFLCKNNDLEAFASGLDAALSLTGDERAEMGKAARRYVIQNFSLDVVTQKWCKIYNG